MAYTGTYAQSFSSGGRTGGGLTNNDPTYREQILFDSIAYVQGVEVPFLNVLNRVPLWNTEYSFLMGNIDFDRTTIPADVEGKQHTALGDASQQFRVRAYNGIHIHSKEVLVSDLYRNMREVGAADEYQHRVWEQMIALMVEFENILLWSRFVQGTESTFGAAATAPQTHGLYAWAYDTGRAAGTVTIAGHAVPSPYKSTYYTGTGADITRKQFNDNILEPAWVKGMEIDKALWWVGTKVKRLISQWGMTFQGSGATLSATPLNDRNIPASAMRIIDKIDIYHSDWGVVYVIKNRNMAGSHTWSAGGWSGSPVSPQSAIFGFEPRYVDYGVMEAPNHVPLAKLGSTSQGYIEGIMGAVIRNPRAMAAAHDIAA